jgi:hypothetical protein
VRPPGAAGASRRAAGGGSWRRGAR